MTCLLFMGGFSQKRLNDYTLGKRFSCLISVNAHCEKVTAANVQGGAQKLVPVGKYSFRLDKVKMLINVQTFKIKAF